MKKRLSLLLALMILSGLFACTPKEAQTDDPADGPTATGTLPAPVKDTLSLRLSSDPASLDPNFWTSPAEWTIYHNIFDKLYHVDSLRGVVEPRLAESHTVSGDGLMYTFTLRQGVTFHNGDAFTADDVAFTLRRAISSPYIGRYVAGLTPENITVVDAYTIELRLEEAFGPFFDNVCSLFILPEAYYTEVTAAVFRDAPVGTGAYRFVSRTPGFDFTLAANPDYYRGCPQIGEVTFKIAEDAKTADIALETGELDMGLFEPVSYPNIAAVEDLIVRTVESSSFYGIIMNMDKAPFDNKLVRQAIACAIDRDAIVEIAAEGFGVPNSRMTSPMVFGHSESAKGYTYDPEQAKALLAEAGITAPINIGTLTCYAATTKIAEVVMENLRAVGLNGKMEVVEMNSYVRRSMDGDYDIGIIQISLGNDAGQWNLMLATEYIGNLNLSRFSNADVDRLFDEALHTADRALRLAAYDELFKIVQEEAPYVILYNPVSPFAYKKDLAIVINDGGMIEYFDCHWN